LNTQGQYAEVLLPLPLGDTFTYAVPEGMYGQVIIGGRVVVQFGNRKIYTALVVEIHQTPPEGYQAKEILSVLDEHPVVHPLQLTFWDWIASYYLCHKGEVMNAAFPSALKLASESGIKMNPEAQVDLTLLNEREQLLIESLGHRKQIKIVDISGILGIQKVIPVIKTLLEKGLILMEEELTDSWKPKKDVFVRLTRPFHDDEDQFRELFTHLEKKAKKQLELLMSFLVISKYGIDDPEEVSKTTLLKSIEGSSAPLEGLIRKGVLETYERKPLISSLDPAADEADLIILSEVQQMALDAIRQSFTDKDVTLLHGVTSSGKTEIYIKLIKETIDKGKQVLFLVPEIALTAQTINRLKKYFGEGVGIYHSRFNESERVETWNHVLAAGNTQIVLGARSAVFLPFSNLGLVIIDEEHDASYKQNDPAPRYHGRDAALYLAHLHGAKTLLGSATPCLESYYNASEGKYALVEVPERYGQMEMPEIIVVDLKNETRWKKMKSHFSSVLVAQVGKALENKEQVILFQNRRGFSLRLECESCNWMPSCRNCDVTLVYHKSQDLLRCHYCGYSVNIPQICPSCKGTDLKMKGFGTEKVEEELGILFPEARIARMDLDTTRSKNAYRKILDDFDRKDVDILVGTQMVTKGLDFENVSTVCILNADSILSFPDFRAAERGFQLMAQVSGRSGRKNKRGKVIIQTNHPDNPVILDVVHHDFLAMYNTQLLDRRKFKYPPYYRLIQLRVKHKDPKILNRAASVLAGKLRSAFGNRVLGPEYPLVSRVMNYYLKNILVKIERSASQTADKKKLVKEIAEFYKEKEFSSVRIIVDVDPQ